MSYSFARDTLCLTTYWCLRASWNMVILLASASDIGFKEEHSWFSAASQIWISLHLFPQIVKPCHLESHCKQDSLLHSSLSVIRFLSTHPHSHLYYSILHIRFRDTSLPTQLIRTPSSFFQVIRRLCSLETKCCWCWISPIVQLMLWRFLGCWGARNTPPSRMRHLESVVDESTLICAWEVSHASVIHSDLVVWQQKLRAFVLFLGQFACEPFVYDLVGWRAFLWFCLSLYQRVCWWS